MSNLRERLDDGLLAEILRTGLGRGADFAEVYAEDRQGRSLRLEDRRVEELTSDRDLGAGIRVISGDRVGYAYTNVLERDALLDTARAAAAGAVGDAGREPTDLTAPERRVDHPVKREPFEADKTAIVELATRSDEAAREVGTEVTQVIVRYVTSAQEILVANSDGRLADDRRVHTRFAAQVVAARGDLVQTGTEAPGTAGGHELFDASPPDEIGRVAARRAIAMLDSRPSPTGEMPVVLWRGDGGVIFHEACGHGMEADLVSKGASIYAGKQGQRLASDLVNGVDDATVQNGWGSFAFDDEGMPATRTVLFNDGVLGDYLTDRRSSRRLGVATTGNGRRQSYAHLPVPRMTNTYILPGQSSPADAMASLDRGILCKGLGGGQVNTVTGDFVFGMTEAYLVENGEIAYPIRNANLVGNAIDAMGAVDLVCNDVAFRQGMCGKRGQAVPAGVGTPTIRIARLTIGGTA